MKDKTLAKMTAVEEFERWRRRSGGKREVFTTFCPYRICPLGAHVDHQYGLVTGFAIDKGVTVAYSPTNGVFRARSLNFQGEKSFSLTKIPEKQNDWADYLRGAVWALSRHYPLRRGLNCVIEGTLPIGGLSSSAAVIIAFLSALLRVNDLALSRSQLIDVALEAESQYVGVHVGKLDQSCEVYSQRDKLLYLDTKDGSYELIPRHRKTPEFEIAIFFSGVERKLGSAFNVRVDELKAAAYALKGWAGMDYGKFGDTRLRDVPYVVFEKYGERLPEPWRKRASHFYSEMERVKAGVHAWRYGKLRKFGQLVFQSGLSSIEQYQTGSDELRTLYEIMRETPGIYGGRFSGAGFKGCCMALIDPAAREAISSKIETAYLKEFPNLEGKFSIHFCQTADGAAF